MDKQNKDTTGQTKYRHTNGQQKIQTQINSKNTDTQMDKQKHRYK